jgi:EAL and modified HD-GYP domain-containing signal transduction protein
VQARATHAWRGVRARIAEANRHDADSVCNVVPLRTEAPRVAGDQVFLARQPILDRQRQVHAYELLFRASPDTPAADTMSSEATARVITDVMVAFDIDSITHRRPAFINVTRDLLISGVPASLPPKRFVIELLENIEADAEVLAACEALNEAGYQIALDDF